MWVYFFFSVELWVWISAAKTLSSKSKMDLLLWTIKSKLEQDLFICTWCHFTFTLSLIVQWSALPTCITITGAGKCAVTSTYRVSFLLSGNLITWRIVSFIRINQRGFFCFKYQRIHRYSSKRDKILWARWAIKNQIWSLVTLTTIAKGSQVNYTSMNKNMLKGAKLRERDKNENTCML